MRSNGNDINVSWKAAYAFIKRQKSSLFKTSPEHASAMITEAVVDNPGKFPDCVKYLGDLFVSESSKPTKTKTGHASTQSNLYEYNSNSRRAY